MNEIKTVLINNIIIMKPRKTIRIYDWWGFFLLLLLCVCVVFCVLFCFCYCFLNANADWLNNHD